MVERFNALSDRHNLHFEVWFNDRDHVERSWIIDESMWRFQYRYINTISFPNRKLHFPLNCLKGRRPDVLISLYAKPSFLFGWVISRIRRVRTGFWVEVTFDRWVRRTAFKETIKKIIFPRVDFIVTVGKDGQNFAQHYGVPLQRIFLAPHRIDSKYYHHFSSITGSKRSQVREKLGVVGTTFIYVGRLLKKKGLEFLLEAFNQVQCQSRSEVSIIFVGDGVHKNFFRQKCKENGLRNVVFTGFLQRSELPYVYAAADIFVFPTLGDPYGLVVDEAMACSMPVISTSAVGELHYRVKDGLNGYIVPPGNSQELSVAMLKLVGNPILQRRMGSISRVKIKDSSPEKWAKDFEHIVFSVLSNSPR